MRCFVRCALEDFFEIEALAVQLAGEQVSVFESDVVEFLARDVVVEIIVVVVLSLRGRRGRQLDEFAVFLVLNDAVDVAVGGVVPDSLRGHVHGEAVLGLLVV